MKSWRLNRYTPEVGRKLDSVIFRPHVPLAGRVIASEPRKRGSRRIFKIALRCKVLALGACAIAAILAGTSMGPGQGVDGKTGWVEDGKESDAPFAVVELFTSEGCSSCPPADIVLADILQDARKNRRRVFGLSFHVDYWNRLGWTDPYSAPKYSQRQQAYAQDLKNDQVYTPQTIVNGTEEFVGSNRARSHAAIEAALKRPACALVKLQHKKPSAPDALALTFEVTRAQRGAVLQVAVVQRGVVSKVKQGENAGRTLRHENVVRVFTTIRLGGDGKGSVELILPQDLVRQNASVIAYVQEDATRAVLGATALALPPDAPS